MEISCHGLNVRRSIVLELKLILMLPHFPSTACQPRGYIDTHRYVHINDDKHRTAVFGGSIDRCSER